MHMEYIITNRSVIYSVEKIMHYEEFEKQIKQHKQFHERWAHILPSIPHRYHERYIVLLDNGFNMPDAFDLILASQGLTDDKFIEKLKKRFS